MSEFQKGQLVAVKVYSDENWEPAIFERMEGKFYLCRSLLNKAAWLERPWVEAKPAEEVWTEIYIARDRDRYLAFYKSNKDMFKQIQWLCDQMEKVVACYGTKECPEYKIDNCAYGCHTCWYLASLKALEEPEEDEEESDD